MKKLLTLLIILSFVGIGSCKKEEKDPDYCTSTAWTQQLADELTAYMSAAMTYSSSPTAANCNALKTSLQAYINALKPFEKCSLWTAEQKAQFHDALVEAEDDLADACD